MESPYHSECGKVRHPSRKVALRSLRRVRDGLRSYGKDDGTLGVYLCKSCLGYHVGNAALYYDKVGRQLARRKRVADQRREEGDEPAVE